MTIESPFAWILDRLNRAVGAVGSANPEQYWSPSEKPAEDTPRGDRQIRRIGVADLRDALVRGYDDFASNRTDVIFLCVAYPIIGLILGRLASGYELAPLLFPLASGFALIGPLAAIGLNEMSRRREQGADVSWVDAFGVLRSPSIGSIAMLGVVLIVIFLAWLTVADAIYIVTFGPQPPTSIMSFIHDVFATRAGWTLIVVGVGVGFLFAVLSLSISVVSFPLLLDHNVGLRAAVMTSVRTVATNPATMAVWGLIVACGLVIGSIPFFLGLVVVMPVLGHATWHLYRRVVM